MNPKAPLNWDNQQERILLDKAQERERLQEGLADVNGALNDMLTPDAELEGYRRDLLRHIAQLEKEIRQLEQTLNLPPGGAVPPAS
jgi:hypothetical protein